LEEGAKAPQLVMRLSHIQSLKLAASGPDNGANLKEKTKLETADFASQVRAI